MEALKKGLHPHQPIGDYLPHDVIVTNDAGRCFKVQVKGTDNLHTQTGRKHSRWRITASRGAGKTKVPLDCSKVDVVAAHVHSLDVWYLIPCLHIKSMAVWLYADNPSSKAQYEIFKEDWNYFLG